LQAGYDDILASEWFPGVLVPKLENPLNEREHYRSELRKAYSPYGVEVSVACGERFWNGVWPSMEPPVAYWARIALGHVLLFVAGVCPRPDDDEYVTVFPFPDASVKDVAAWFCTDWWCQIGYEFYLGRVTSDAAIFAHQFKH